MLLFVNPLTAAAANGGSYFKIQPNFKNTTLMLRNDCTIPDARVLR